MDLSHEAAAPEGETLPAKGQHGGDRTYRQFGECPPEVTGDAVDGDQVFQRKSLGSPDRPDPAIEAAPIKAIQHGQIPFS
jgi:hypothetical protein